MEGQRAGVEYKEKELKDKELGLSREEMVGRMRSRGSVENRRIE